jgi:transposase-like protein
VKIRGEMQYLWRAAAQDGEVVDVFVQADTDNKVAKRLFRRLAQVPRRGAAQDPD